MIRLCIQKHKKKFSVVLVLLLTVIGTQWALQYLDRCQTKNVVEAFLNNIIEGDYDKAFEYVAYHKDAVDYDPEISYKQAKEIWVNRIKKAKENGTYVKEYKDVQIHMRDPQEEGTVKLSIIQEGKPIKQKIFFIDLYKYKNGEYRVSGIYGDRYQYFDLNRKKQPWTIIMSGNIDWELKEKNNY